MNKTDKINILIVEDELIIAEDIRLKIIDLGYNPIGIATSFDEAIEILKESSADIALIDINIYGKKDGIDLARKIKNDHNLPIVFVTSNADKSTIERAKAVKPDGYLVKPFNEKDLYSSIEIAFFNSVNANPLQENHEKAIDGLGKENIFIKVDSKLIKLKIQEIKWIKSEGNYLEIFCSDKKHLTRSSLKEFLAKLPENSFMQVHKSFVININFVDAIEYSNLFIDNEKIPLSRTIAGELKKRFGID